MDATQNNFLILLLLLFFRKFFIISVDSIISGFPNASIKTECLCPRILFSTSLSGSETVYTASNDENKDK